MPREGLSPNGKGIAEATLDRAAATWRARCIVVAATGVLLLLGGPGAATASAGESLSSGWSGIITLKSDDNLTGHDVPATGAEGSRKLVESNVLTLDGTGTVSVDSPSELVTNQTFGWRRSVSSEVDEKDFSACNFHIIENSDITGQGSSEAAEVSVRVDRSEVNPEAFVSEANLWTEPGLFMPITEHYVEELSGPEGCEQATIEGERTATSLFPVHIHPYSVLLGDWIDFSSLPEEGFTLGDGQAAISGTNEDSWDQQREEEGTYYTDVEHVWGEASLATHVTRLPDQDHDGTPDSTDDCPIVFDYPQDPSACAGRLSMHVLFPEEASADSSFSASGIADSATPAAPTIGSAVFTGSKHFDFSTSGSTPLTVSDVSCEGAGFWSPTGAAGAYTGLDTTLEGGQSLGCDVTVEEAHGACTSRELVSAAESWGLFSVPVLELRGLEYDPLSFTVDYSLGEFQLCEGGGAKGPQAAGDLSLNPPGTLSVPVTVDGQFGPGPFEYSIPRTAWLTLPGFQVLNASFDPQGLLDLHTNLHLVDFLHPGTVQLELAKLTAGTLTVNLVDGALGQPFLSASNTPEVLASLNFDLTKFYKLLKALHSLVPNEKYAREIAVWLLAGELGYGLSYESGQLGLPGLDFPDAKQWAKGQFKDLVDKGYSSIGVKCGHVCQILGVAAGATPAVLKYAPKIAGLVARSGLFVVENPELAALAAGAKAEVRRESRFASTFSTHSGPATTSGEKTERATGLLPVRPVRHLRLGALHLVSLPKKENVQAAARQVLQLPVRALGKPLLTTLKGRFAKTHRIIVAGAGFPNRTRHKILVTVDGPNFHASRVVEAARGVSVVSLGLPRHKKAGRWAIGMVDASHLRPQKNGLKGKLQLRLGVFTVH
jgi:hypothetical protein